MGNGPSSLHQAALEGEIDRVRLSIQDNPSLIDATEPTNGWTALHISASKGYEVIVRELLARGAAPNLVDKDGRTALHLSAGQGHCAVIRDLLRKGADPLRRDMAGKSPLDIALEQQQPAAASLLAEALAGRGIGSSNTPTDSPTTAQGAAGYPFGVAAGAAAGPAAAGYGALPHLGGLTLGQAPPLVGGAGANAGAGAGAGAYPSVPASFSGGDMDWLQRLPVPPSAGTAAGGGGGGYGVDGPVSIAAPSAPPVSGIYPSQPQPQQPQQPQQAQGRWPWQQPPKQQQQQPQQPPQQEPQQLPQQAAVDYYDYIVPTPPPAAPPAAAKSSPYPAVPPPAAGVQAYPQTDTNQRGSNQQQQYQHQHQYQQQQHAAAMPQQPAAQQPQQPAAAAAAGGADGGDADSDGGWGGGSEDDWGGDDDRPSASRPGAGPRDKQGQPLNVNAAVGAAVSGAGKVAGAVGSIAVAGAKQLLTGLIPKPPGKGNDGSDLSAPGSPSAAAATWAGTPGRTYTYGELAAATQGFNEANKLGAGGYGPVYRGVLDGLPVAVKLLDPAATGGQQGPKEFQAEVAILSRLHHPHIVLLIGSCPERCALVYELLDYGSLEHHLFNPGMPELAWQDRVRMACEVASALVFLHSAPEPIIHMDLKPGNLLLNRSLLCKVGDVGLSRLMPGGLRTTAGGSPLPGVSTVMDSRLVGTPCYMDPEYLRTGRFGPKSDVYSLGVILLQMLTGLEASKVVAVVEAALARSKSDPASFATIIDPRSGAWPITEAASFAHLAVRCVGLQRVQRPDLRGEVLPALLQLAERSKLYSSSAPVKRSISISSSTTPPSMMICPITQDVMEDPVFAADGYTYERIAIAAWISSHTTSPMTNLPLADNRLTPNLALRSAIKEWQDRHSR